MEENKKKEEMSVEEKKRVISSKINWRWQRVIETAWWITYRIWWWKPWWKKKGWPAKWTVSITRAQVEWEVIRMAQLVEVWAEEITHPDNIRKWLKPYTPLKVSQAVKEMWMSLPTFYNHLSRYPELKEELQLYKANRREAMKNLAEENMLEILETWDLSDKERFDASFKIAQATMKEYNPKVEIESKSIWINIHKSTDDLLSELKNILW